MGPLIDDHVIGVNLANGPRQLLVQFDQLAAVQIVVLVGERLVQKVVAGDNGLVPVTASELPPQAHGQLPVPGAREQLRHPMG